MNLIQQHPYLSKWILLTGVFALGAGGGKLFFQVPFPWLMVSLASLGIGLAQFTTFRKHHR